LELADEIASAQNPLTARVTVNRLWYYLFGRGLVATVDNFGRLGEKPTHPELLDFLAARFVEKGWSIKDTIRFLVTSRAYQQSWEPTEAALREDPANELLSHMRVNRLDAESIRDSVLAVSGQLDLRQYGPGPEVYFVGKTEGGPPPGPLDGDRRRSVYLRIRRNAQNPFLEVFDAPKPASTRGKRDVTNVPAQSLAMLNDPFVIDQAAKWAKSILSKNPTTELRVQSMFEQAFARPPTSIELAEATDFLADLAKTEPDNEKTWQELAQSLFALKEFIYVR
jgi:hypothetical protein